MAIRECLIKHIYYQRNGQTVKQTKIDEWKKFVIQLKAIA